MKITKTQRAALQNAKDTGLPWQQADGKMAPNSSTNSFRMMIERLQKDGLLYGLQITQAGIDALK